MKNVIYFDFQQRRRNDPVVVAGAFPGNTAEPQLSIHQLLALARTNPGLFLSQNRPNRFLSPALFRDAVWRANVIWQQPNSPNLNPPPFRPAS